MAKRKNKVIDDRPTWLLKIERANTFEGISEAVKDFKLILESNVGNRDEDIINDNTGSDTPDTCDVDLAG